MVKETKTPSIQPQPGYILCQPYIKKDQVFKPAKESDGLDQSSEVIAVGDAVFDQNNVLRTTTVRPGDIIYHAYSNKEIEVDFTKYRFCHFTEVHGVIK